MITNVDKELRIAFCKDLCNDLIVDGEYPPVYPQWAKDLALQMIRLGWKKSPDD